MKFGIIMCSAVTLNARSAMFEMPLYELTFPLFEKKQPEFVIIIAWKLS